MCTAATYQTKDFYFARTLDYEVAYGEDVVITPRNYPFRFRQIGELPSHYAMIGIAHLADGCPLYYEAVNEKGLGMAGLNFVGNAVYFEPKKGWDNISPFEFIPWILGQCATVQEARKKLERLCLVNIPFSDALPLSQLHWMVADRTGCLVVESMASGLQVYENPAGVLTNNPPFPEQLFNLNNYMGLSPYPAVNRFCSRLKLNSYSRGMGAIGLPGDLSSQSRFVRAAFVRANSVSSSSEAESISQLFHILGSVEQQRGACRMEDGQCEITLYTGCYNGSRGILYYTSYDNHQISAVDMNREDLNAAQLIRYPMVQGEHIHWQN